MHFIVPIVTPLIKKQFQIQNGLFDAFQNSPEVCQVMIMSEFLRDAIQELNDVNGAVAVCVRLEKSKGMMVCACLLSTRIFLNFNLSA